jgi:hypothetical protein
MRYRTVYDKTSMAETHGVTRSHPVSAATVFGTPSATQSRARNKMDDIQKAIAQIGHDTEKFKAPDEVYNKLPECCLYRE